MKYLKVVLPILLFALSNTANAVYVIAGNDAVVSSNSGNWSWDGSEHAEFRQALENGSNFGAGGIVGESVSTVNLGINITSSSLAGVDLFVSSWWTESESAIYHNVLLDFFSNGGDLILFQDGSSRDGLGSLLGISTTTSSSAANPNTILSPLANGPFGTINNTVNQVGEIGVLDFNAIIASGGSVCGENANGVATIGCWEEGAFGLGYGSLTIFADVDFISGIFGGADFDPLNDKGRLALNTVNFHINAPSPVPVPAAAWLFGSALLGFFGFSRRKINA